jgi:hypothetical protein
VSSSVPGAVGGQPRTYLRLEGLAVFAASLLFYRWRLEPWPTFLILFLVPDLSMLGYLAGPRVGARLYNVAHSYVGPIFLVVWSLRMGVDSYVTYAQIWIAHIGFDRMLGLGLKYPTAFADTHLGWPGFHK